MSSTFKAGDILKIADDAPFHAGKSGVFKTISKLNPNHVTLAAIDCPILWFAVSLEHVTKV